MNSPVFAFHTPVHLLALVQQPDTLRARLADLMIEHDIGVSTTRTILIKRIDSDYFEEN